MNKEEKREFRIGDRIQFRYTPKGKLKLGQILGFKEASIIKNGKTRKEKYAQILILREKRKHPIKNFVIPYKELERAEFNPSERCCN